MLLSAIVLLAVFLIMAGEAALSAFNERLLRARGAMEPSGDVYPVMKWVYPACFVAMAVEGAIRGPWSPTVLAAGLAIFGFAKALKLWVITSLGPRWTFRVLVLPGERLVDTGPYRFLRHPNYVAVLAELAGVALIVGAPVSGVASVAVFGTILARRIRVEDRALGRQ